MSWLRRFTDKLSRTQKVVLLCLLGAFVGAGCLFLYMLRFTTYLGNDPSACMNCHIMAPYYASWDHSSHARNATCNDCHVPHENVARKYVISGILYGAGAKPRLEQLVDYCKSEKLASKTVAKSVGFHTA